MGYFRMVIWGLGTSVATGLGGAVVIAGGIVAVGFAAGYAYGKNK
jgi:hypothetical protein